MSETVTNLAELLGPTAAHGGGGEGDLVRLCGQVVGFFDGGINRAALWFRLPKPLLGEVSPRDMIRYGRVEQLARFVDEALEENRFGMDAE